MKKVLINTLALLVCYLITCANFISFYFFDANFKINLLNWVNFDNRLASLITLISIILVFVLLNIWLRNNKYISAFTNAITLIFYCLYILMLLAFSNTVPDFT